MGIQDRGEHEGVLTHRGGEFAAVEQPQGSLYMFGSIVKALHAFCTKTTHLTSQSFVPEA